ncbi:MAG: hypothetical protein LBV21_00685 [Candidatus Adiutrix sp.]|nr:hypothetical protein [Candidatus Adiutrix sp.]
MIFLAVGWKIVPKSYLGSYPVRYSLSDLAGEPPISQADIEAWIKIRPALRDLQETGTIKSKDQKTVVSLAETNGLSHKRLYFLRSKLPIISQAALGYKVNEIRGSPESMRVRPEEVALLKRNWDRFAMPGSPRPAED